MKGHGSMGAAGGRKGPACCRALRQRPRWAACHRTGSLIDARRQEPWLFRCPACRPKVLRWFFHHMEVTHPPPPPPPEYPKLPGLDFRPLTPYW